MKIIFNAVFILLLLGFLTGCGGALQNAAHKGDINTINGILDKGADINESDFVGTALFWASRACQVETVKLLTVRGADVNAENSDGHRPLHVAAWNGCNDVVEILVSKGAKIDATDKKGISPLAWAARQGYNETVQLLIEKGANQNIAIQYLTKIRRDDAAQIVKMAAQRAEESKAQIAVSKAAISKADVAELPVVVKSDIDDSPTIILEPRKNAYAIVIGIEQYRQKLPKADFAVSDAKLVSDYLTKAMGYPEKNVLTLTNEHAAFGDFVKYFEKWLPNNVENESSVFVYYSGHGAPDLKTGGAYLVPYDGDPSFIAETGYSLQRMYDALGKLPAKEIVVMLDSCFSGAGGRSVIAEGARPLVMNISGNMVLAKNMTVVSASSGEQISSTYDEKGHGLFTYFLLKGIKNEGVLKPDGSIKMDDLFGYIKPQVERIARKQYNNEQTPQLMGANKK